MSFGSDDALRVTLHPRADGLELVLAGDMDLSTVKSLPARILAALDVSGGPNLTLDMAALDDLDTRGLRALLILSVEVERRGGTATLRNLRGRPRRLVHVGGLADRFALES